MMELFSSSTWSVEHWIYNFFQKSSGEEIEAHMKWWMTEEKFPTGTLRVCLPFQMVQDSRFDFLWSLMVSGPNVYITLLPARKFMSFASFSSHHMSIMRKLLKNFMYTLQAGHSRQHLGAWLQPWFHQSVHLQSTSNALQCTQKDSNCRCKANPHQKLPFSALYD